MSLAFDTQDTRPPTLPAARRDFAALNRTRKNAGISVMRLMSAADISHHTWDAARNGRSATRASTLARLWTALDRLRDGGATVRPPAALKALVLAAEEILRARIREAGDDDNLLLSAITTRWQRGRIPIGRLRRLAIYLVAVEIETGADNQALADALGCTRQAIKKSRDAIEAIRVEGGALDRLLTRCGDLLGGRR